MTRRAHRVRIYAGAAVLVMACARPDHGAVTRCGTVISAPGVYHLAADLIDCPATGISISSSNVTQRLDGHSITSQGARKLAESTVGVGIGLGVVGGVSRVHVLGPGVVRGFFTGMSMEQASHSTAAGITLEKNVFGFGLNAGFGAMQKDRPSRFNTITRMTLRDNRGHGFTVHGAEDNLLSGNTVTGTVEGMGILLYKATRIIVTGNRLTGNHVGIGIVGPDEETATANHILDNDSRGNVVYDLEDRWKDCTHNTWRGNRFTTASIACLR
jgi:parallel beta-helix repeat protein